MSLNLVDPIEKIIQATANGDGELLLCHICQNAVTRTGEQTEIGVSNHYRFTNPAGITYSVDCFRNAPGCAIIGDPTEQDSWFGSYRWQIAICCECREHLGWYYQNASERYFFGLIPDRLVRETSDKEQP